METLWAKALSALRLQHYWKKWNAQKWLKPFENDLVHRKKCSSASQTLRTRNVKNQPLVSKSRQMLRTVNDHEYFCVVLVVRTAW